MNVNIPFCVDEETQARMAATPARDHTAAPPGTPVWLASALLFSELLCSLPAAPTLLDREGERGAGRRDFSPLGFCIFQAQPRTGEELGRNWVGSAPLTGACQPIPEPTPQVPREGNTQSVVCRLPLPLPLSTNWSSYPRIQPSPEAGIYVLMC